MEMGTKMGSLRQIVLSKPQIKADGYIQELKSPQNRGKVILLVEGPDDRDFYEGFFSTAKTMVRPNSGCLHAENVLKILQVHPKIRCLLIRDADFLRLQGINTAEDILLTDCHDYEMMVMSCNEARKMFFHDLGIPSYQQLFNFAFDILNLLSYFKWINDAQQLRYKVNEVFKDRQDLECIQDIDALITAANSKSRPNRKITKKALKTFINANGSADKYEYTNGHDFIKALILRLNTSQYGKNESTKSMAARLLRCYNMEHFRTTLLHSNLLLWQKSHKVTILLPN